MQSFARKSAVTKGLWKAYCLPRRPVASTRSGLRDEVSQLDTGRSPVEELSGETNTVVTDIMDIDRTPELLAWLFSGIFGRNKQTSPPALSNQIAVSTPKSPTGDAVAQVLSTSTGSRDTPDVIVHDKSSLQNRPSDGITTSQTDFKATSASPADPASYPSSAIEIATVGGGCFWCIEACFLELHGVLSVISGYAGGQVPNPTYQQVCSKNTGHAEVVQIQYDANILSYKALLQVFMSIHDPTTPNRSGNDVGPQYRSIILTHDEQQVAVAVEVLEEANRALWFGRKVCTEVAPLRSFYQAESYHQRYNSRNPGAGYCVFVVQPKLQVREGCNQQWRRCIGKWNVAGWAARAG